MGILGVLGLLGGKGFFNSRHPGLVKMSVNLKHLPAVFDGLKVGQITDIHAGPLVPREPINKGVDLLLAEKPDLVVLTGDFVSGATKCLWTTYGGFKQRHFDYCMNALGRLKAPLGVYGVLGNHDFWSGSEVLNKIVRGLEEVGVQVLRNESIGLERKGKKIYVAGVDDYWESSYSLTRALQGVPEDACRILLSHNPDVNEEIENMKERIDFIMSGHTHGGQVVLPFVGALYVPSPFGQKYLSGLVNDRERQTYISRGLGSFFVPIRLNCPSDVSLLTLRSERDMEKKGAGYKAHQPSLKLWPAGGAAGVA